MPIQTPTWRADRACDYVVASQSQQRKVRNVGVEDFDATPRRAVTFLVEKEKEIQELRELTHCQDTVVVKLPGRSKAEGGEEEKEVIDEVRRVDKEVMSAMEGKRIGAKELREADTAGVGVNLKAASGAQSSKAEIGPSDESGVGVNQKGPLEMRNAEESASGHVVPETRRHRGQRWDCSQIERE